MTCEGSLNEMREAHGNRSPFRAAVNYFVAIKGSEQIFKEVFR